MIYQQFICDDYYEPSITATEFIDTDAFVQPIGFLAVHVDRSEVAPAYGWRDRIRAWWPFG